MFSLTKEDQLQVRVTIRRGKSAREINRAHCLNLREKGRTIIEIADTLELTPRTVINICSAYQEYGLEGALKDDPRSGRPEEFDDRVKSYVVATVCSDPPEGFDRWTLELLKGRLEKDEIVPSISIGSIWAILKEHDLKPWQQKMWCVPVLDEEYIERMEAILDVYELPHNPEVPCGMRRRETCCAARERSDRNPDERRMPEASRLRVYQKWDCECVLRR